MNRFLLLDYSNLALGVLIGLVVWCLSRLPLVSRRPALCHGLWVIVLLKLVTPPLIFIPIFPAVERAQTRVNSATGDPVVVRQNTRRVVTERKPVVTEAPFGQGRTRESIVSPTLTDQPSFLEDIKQLVWKYWLTAIPPILIAFSLSVTLAMWFSAVRQMRRVYRLIATDHVHNERVEGLVEQLTLRMKLKLSPRIVIVDSAISPVLWADLRNVFLVLPKSVIESLDDHRLRNIIAHELAHYARRDYWTNLFGFVVTTLMWWHPMAWLARREMSLAAESCCDAMAVAFCGESRKSYAQTLLCVVDFVNSGKLQRPQLGLSFGGTHSIRRRIEMLARSQINTTVSFGGWATLFGVALVSLLLPARAQEEKAPTSPSPSAVQPHNNPKTSTRQTKSDAEKSSTQPGKYFVTGSVIDDVTNASIPQAKLSFFVESEPDPNKRLRRITTDDQGQFRLEVPIGTTRLWFPELRPGYWLEAGHDNQAVVTTSNEPVATLEIRAKKGNMWPVQIVVEGGLPENTLPVISAMEMEDDTIRKKAVNGEQWSMMKLTPRSILWLTTNGLGNLTECGTSGKLFVTSHITFDPATTDKDRQEPPAFTQALVELIVDPGFDATQVTSATPLAETDKVELLDKNGAKATITKAKVTVTNGRPLLTFHLSRIKLDRKIQEYVGRIVDARQQPLSDVRVGVVRGVAGGGSGDTGLETKTDHDGRFQLKLPVYESKDQEVVSFVFNRDGFAGMDSRSYPISKEPSEPVDIGVVRLKERNSYSIRVLDERDHPIVGAVIEPMDSYALRRMLTRTDAMGRAVLQNLPQGVVSISIRHGKLGMNREIVVNPGNSKELSLRLKSLAQPVVDTPEPAQEKERLAVGQAAPEFAIEKWTDGKSHELADYRGRVVLIDFWGLWCRGCADSIPMLTELETKYESKGVAFLSIHTPDGELGPIDELKKLHQWKALTGIDRGTTTSDGETARRYGIQGFPTLILIDPAGQIAFNSSVPPSEQTAFMDEVRQIAESLSIPWPLAPANDENAEEAMNQFSRILTVKMEREIDKVLVASKAAKKPEKQRDK